MIGQAIVQTAGQGTYRIDGSLRDILTAPRWRFVGMDGDFCVFTQSAARGRAWVDGDPGSLARVVSDTPWGAETIRVDTTRPAVLIRSVQFSSGWQATVTRGRGPARSARSRAADYSSRWPFPPGSTPSPSSTARRAPCWASASVRPGSCWPSSWPAGPSCDAVAVVPPQSWASQFHRVCNPSWNSARIALRVEQMEPDVSAEKHAAGRRQPEPGVTVKGTLPITSPELATRVRLPVTAVEGTRQTSLVGCSRWSGWRRRR